jgi:Zn-dependent metalloprotease
MAKKFAGLNAKVEMHPLYKVPRRIYDIETRSPRARALKATAKKTTGGDEAARLIAENFLKGIADKISVRTDHAHLRFDKVKHSILGKHVLFQQYYDGKPISDAWLRVDLDKDSNVYNVQNDLIPTTIIEKSAQSRKARAAKAVAPDPTAAVKTAFKETGCAKSKTREALETQLVYFPHKGVPTLAWKVIVRGTRPTREWKVYVDAANGKVLEKINLLKDAAGKGRIFDPNPVVKLNNTTLKDRSPIPAAAYSDVTLNALDNTGLLDGDFVSTRRTANRVKKTNLKFQFKRGQRGFKEVMAYFHIDRVQRYIKSLGFNNVLGRAIEVDVAGEAEDNSAYSTVTKSLAFGTGGVDDAEDAEIILHEYGHAIQDDQVPGFGASTECGAMGEGFGDYLAASFFESMKAAPLKPCVGTWDAVAYSRAKPPNLRRLDSKKKYPQDIDHEVHDDGEIWSACLWQIRAAIGRKTADKLIIAHHFLVNRRASFADAANALITADKNLNGGRNEAVIRDVFKRRGILKA